MQGTNDTPESQPAALTERQRREERSDDAAADLVFRCALIRSAHAALFTGRKPAPSSPLAACPTGRSLPLCRTVLIHPSGSMELLARTSKPYLAVAAAYAFIARTLRGEVQHGSRVIAYATEFEVEHSWRLSATGWKDTK